MAEHGNGDQKVAAPAHQVVQSLAFGAEHDGAVHVVVEFVVALRAALVEADGPHVAFFQLVQRARDVGDARDRQMLGRSRRSLHRGARQSRGAPLGNDDAVGAGAIGGANERAQVVRVFHAVEHDQEAVLAVALFEQRVHVGVLLAAGDGDDALMGVGVGGAIELLARQEADLHSAGAAVVNQALHPLIMPLARDADVLEAARARLQRLADRMNAVDDDHVSSVYDRKSRQLSAVSRQPSIAVGNLQFRHRSPIAALRSSDTLNLDN